MTSSEDVLRGQMKELKEKILNVKKEIAKLQKRRRAYTAKLRLLENHLEGHHIKGDTENTDSDDSDESFSTTELLELSLSSISSSVLGSSVSHDDSDQSDLESNVENGQLGRF